MFENKSKHNKNIKFRKINKYDNKYGTAAGSGEPGSSLYGMKDFKGNITDNIMSSPSKNNMYSKKSNTVKPVYRNPEDREENISSANSEISAEKKEIPAEKSAAAPESSRLYDKLATQKSNSKAVNTDRVSKTVSEIVNNSIKETEEEKNTKKELPKSGTDVVKNVLEDIGSEDNKPVFVSHDLFYEKNNEPLIDSKKNTNKDKKTERSNKKAKSVNSQIKTSKKNIDNSAKKATAATPPKNQPVESIAPKATEKNAEENIKAKSTQKKDIKTAAAQKAKKSNIPLKWMDTPSYEKAIAAKNNVYRVPVAILGVIVACIVLYAIFRVPIAGIGLSSGSKYGIKENSGILVNNTDISTLSSGKLKKMLGNGKLNTDDKLVTIRSSDGSFTIDYGFDDFDVVYDVEGTLEKASNYGKNYTSENWWREIKALEGVNTVNFDVIHYNKSKINSAVNAIAKQVGTPAVDATAKKVNGEFEVTPSSVGYSIDSAEIFRQLETLIVERNFGQVITFKISTIKPKFNEANFSEIDNLIGSWSSEYNDADENRVQNLRTACAKLNGLIVYPNEVFSVNQHFMPFTENNGWKNAGTIVDGKIEDSMGGGMCQVSSALYDALLESEVEIVSRNNHTLKVNYADYGMDATLAGNYIDLKFKNDTGAPLYLEAYITNSTVNVNIYGKEIHDSSREIEFESRLIKTIDYGSPIIKYDDTLPEGTEKITTYPLKGKIYELYKKVYENGTLVDTELINVSTYMPREEEKVIGTMKVTPSDNSDSNENKSDEEQNNEANEENEEN